MTPIRQQYLLRRKSMLLVSVFLQSIALLVLCRSPLQVCDCFLQPTIVSTSVPKKVASQQQSNKYHKGTTTEFVSTVVLHLSSRRREKNDNDNNYIDDNEDYRPTTSFGSEAVPENQRPVNEYLDVTSQPFFDWGKASNSGLLVRLGGLYTLFFIFICYPISSATYTMDGYMLQKIVCSNIGCIGVILALLIRLYSGWYYLGQRLTSKNIEYEETGWYDGAYETKTDTEYKRDRFLYNTNVKPVVDRLSKFLYSTVGISIVSIIVCQYCVSINPLPFNQYDPTVLERLVYDEKLANTASETTYGKPAYCNSRYYQAIANGGQGCN